MSNVVATVIAEAVSSMVGWLDSGVDLMEALAMRVVSHARI